MAALKFAETHNLVAFLEKSADSEDFDQIIDFLNASSIRYALTVNPIIFVSHIDQFWSTGVVKKNNGQAEIHALIDERKIVVTKATIRDVLYTKTTTWNEFSSTVASAIICLATNQKFNFSKFIMEGMLRNLETKAAKFLMYPRYVQLLVNQLEGLSTHHRKYVVPCHTKKIFANMKRANKEFSGYQLSTPQGCLGGDGELPKERVAQEASCFILSSELLTSDHFLWERSPDVIAGRNSRDAVQTRLLVLESLRPFRWRKGRNKAYVQVGRVVGSRCHGSYNANNQGRPFQRNNARGNVVAGDCPKETQDSERTLQGQDATIASPGNDLETQLDHIFEADECDAFRLYDIDEGPPHQTYEYHEVNEMQTDEQTQLRFVDSDVTIRVYSNIIPYSNGQSNAYTEQADQSPRSNIKKVRNLAGKDNGENIMKSINEGPFHMGTVSDVIAGGTEGAVQQGPQHEVHANENRTMMERFLQPTNDPLALVSNASVQQCPTQSSSPPQRHIARECPRPKRLQDSDYFKDKMLLMQAQENGAVLDEEQSLFLAGEQIINFDEDVDNSPMRKILALN
ncbi:hypothetical protein Tco_0895541 [Tanacetum coccineum]|uniref:Uncharacterized protein n=1 Tax=Tanacetum coccineum TaxID=301880 RepID=A0ABQ5CL50_9ASTR